MTNALSLFAVSN